MELLIWLIFYLFIYIYYVYRRGIKDFTFWLFSDEILYGEQQIPGVGYYTSSRIISLSQFRVAPAQNIANFERAFTIESPAKSFIVWAK